MEHSNTPDTWQLLYRTLNELSDQLERTGLVTCAALPPTTPPASSSPPPHVPKQTREFLRLLCDPKGYTYKEIAARMHCSPSTLSTYRDRIRKRHGIHGKANLVRWCLQTGLV